MNKKKTQKRFLIGCLTPALILIAIFMVYPTLNIFYMSMFKWGGLSETKTFVGLNNFITLFQDTKFLQSFQNSILLIVVVTIITFGFAVVFANILVRENVKGKGFFRVIFYIPNILSVAVISAIFAQIYAVDTGGLLNNIISLFKPETYESIQFLGDPKIVLYAIAGAMIWQAIGYYMVMYMASISSIPEHLYEAAKIEGASRMTQFFQITLPLIWSNLRTTLTFFVISTINMSFLFVKVLTSGGPGGASEVFLSYLYKQAYDNASYGYGMAIGVIIFIFSFALSAIVNKITERDTIQM
ncbi:sugar ABC transporter permease [Erysipelothrix sp. HDW6C]|uniref:carbohydrate ABC transporter permease n=1 Tax=Erysipelothrix sp. HDW6C TaxID=2714930 RepID=UPI00140D1F7C|nr:sugar ABC transporter permease [Erysipelothrix sp. HDW6C]QIK69193.1 sugar ABC transporter permease [Erysipelothrix sp. HDW6C]